MMLETYIRTGGGGGEGGKVSLGQWTEREVEAWMNSKRFICLPVLGAVQNLVSRQPRGSGGLPNVYGTT